MLALQATSVSHRFYTTTALDGVTLVVPPGDLVGIVGESGSGKTTLLRSFNRMVEPDRGTVQVGGTDVRSVDVTTLRAHIGYVPQNGGLLPHWTIRRNVALVPVLRKLANHSERAEAAMDLVGLPALTFGDRFPWELSGGQRQRAAIARALAGEQDILLLDEPFGALDAISRAALHDTFLELRRQRAFTGILVTHDLAEAARLATRVVVMRGGGIEQDAPMSELRRAPATPYVEQLLARAQASAAGIEGRA